MKRPTTKPEPAPSPPARLIYVVDDEKILLEMAAMVLKAMGYEVRTFASAEAALQALAGAGQRPDLIITDYAMVEMNGLDLIAACRRVEPRLNTILVSGTRAEEISCGASSKPDWFLGKPYRAKDLLAAVGALLGKQT